MVNTSANYKYEAFELGNSNSPAAIGSPLLPGSKDEFQLFTGSINLTRFGTLFGKRIIYNGILLADASDREFGRFKGIVSATVVLSRSKNSSFAIGFMAFLDRTAPIPALPIISYQHEFGNNWSLDLFVPRQVLLRKGIFTNGRISIGSELENELLYVSLTDNIGRTTIYDYRQLELKSGIMYEHNLGYSMIATVRAGLTNYMIAQGTVKSESAKDHTFMTHPDAVGYFNLAISFHPFEKSFQ